ncbi:MAG: hypothetical protein ABI594_09490 [Ginsengibacter sp.]
MNIITNNNEEVFKLYKTKESNWFDFPGANSTDSYSFFRQLKVAMDNENPLAKS